MRLISLASRLFAVAVLCAILPLPSTARAQVHVETELQGRIARQPGQIAPYLELARLYFEQGRFDEAERMLASAIDLVRRQKMTTLSFAPAARPEPSARPVPPGAGNVAVRIGGDIKEPRKIRDVRPVYPPEAQDAKIQGVVILEIEIDEEGNVNRAIVLRSVPMLDQVALDAVQQWKFMPTLLDNEPRRVIMTVTVNFSLKG